MRRSIMIIGLFTLSSCASIPDTPDELISSTKIEQTKCYPRNYKEVSEKVKQFLKQCYRTETVLIPINGIPMPMTSKYQVIEEQGENRNRYSVRSQYGFGISVDIKPSINNCESQVSMYALRSHLREKFDRIDAAINGENPDCGII